MTKPIVGLAAAGLLAVALAGCATTTANRPTASAPSHPSGVTGVSATPNLAVPSIGETPSPTQPARTAHSSQPITTGHKESGPGAARTHCSTAALALRVGSRQGAAGSTYTTLTLQNVSNQPCSLFGYPGVSLLDSTGRRLGQPAARQGPRNSTPVTLSHGQSAAFQLRTVNATCTGNPIRSSRIRVFPPTQYTDLTAAFEVPVCATPTVSTLQRA